jgi:hypothetical protein
MRKMGITYTVAVRKDYEFEITNEEYEKIMSSEAEMTVFMGKKFNEIEDLIIEDEEVDFLIEEGLSLHDETSLIHEWGVGDDEWVKKI